MEIIKLVILFPHWKKCGRNFRDFCIWQEWINFVMKNSKLGKFHSLNYKVTIPSLVDIVHWHWGIYNELYLFTHQIARNGLIYYTYMGLVLDYEVFLNEFYQNLEVCTLTLLLKFFNRFSYSKLCWSFTVRIPSWCDSV